MLRFLPRPVLGSEAEDPQGMLAERANQDRPV